MSRSREEKEAAIREIAYLKWENAGRPTGYDQFFWKQAEIELNSRVREGFRNQLGGQFRAWAEATIITLSSWFNPGFARS